MGEKKERYQNRIELLQGTLDLLICRPSNGASTWLWNQRGDSESLRRAAAVDTGSLFLRCTGWRNRSGSRRNGEFRENKQRAKFYQLTSAGKKQLTRERSKWSQLSTRLPVFCNRKR